MAGKSDEIDREAALRLAWTLPSAAPELDELSEAEYAQLRLRVARVCHGLKLDIAAARALPVQSPERAAAVDALLEAVSELDLELLGLKGEPEAGRLARLYLEGRARMNPERRRRLLLAFVHDEVLDPEGVPETELVLDVVRAADVDLTLLLMRGTCEHQPLRAATRLGQGLAGLLSAGSVSQRALASLVLARWPLPAAVPALREALRSRTLSLRVNALVALERRGVGLSEAELLTLLGEAREHGIYWRREQEEPEEEDEAGLYERHLLAAVERLRPAAAVPLLEQLRNDRDACLYRSALGRAFADQALAHLAPEQLLPEVDRRLARDWPEGRARTLSIVARLPEPLARARLAVAADDVSPPVALRARALWEARFGGPCPVPRTAGPVDALLDGPPSADHATRLLLLDGPPEGAAALAVALLREAPATEALVLLLRYLMGADQHHRREGLPQGTEAWAKALVTRFSPDRVARGLLLFAPRADARRPLFELLAKVARTRQLRGAAAEEARAAAADALPFEDDQLPAMEVLVALRPRPHDWRAIWPFALSTTADGDDPLAQRAREALARVPSCPELNEAILDALARPVRFDVHLAELGQVAASRRVRRALPLLARLLDGFDETRDWSAFVRIGRTLYEARRLDDAWIRRHLRRPDRPLFGVAAWIESPYEVKGARPLLRKALESRARDGRAAIEALWPLFATTLVRWNDPLVDRVLARAPEDAALWFLEQAKVRLSTAGRSASILRLLASESPDIAGRAFDLLSIEPERRRRRLFTAALPKVRVPAVRAKLLVDLGLGHQRPTFWEDGPAFASVLLGPLEGESDEPPRRFAVADPYDWYSEDEDPLPE